MTLTSDGPVVRLAHCRELEYCVPGIRSFCSRNGLDFRRLVKHGLPISDFSRFDDIYVTRLLDVAKEKQ